MGKAGMRNVPVRSGGRFFPCPKPYPSLAFTVLKAPFPVARPRRAHRMGSIGVPSLAGGPVTRENLLTLPLRSVPPYRTGRTAVRGPRFRHRHEAETPFPRHAGEGAVR